MEYVEKGAVNSTFSISFEKQIMGYTQIKNDDGTYERFFLLKNLDTGEDYEATIVEHKGCPSVFDAKEKLIKLVDNLTAFSPVEIDLYLSKSLTEDINEDPKYYIFQYNSKLILDSEKIQIKNKYITSDKNIILAPVYTDDGKHNQLCPYLVGNVYQINGKEFECVADYEEYYIPYNALPDDFVVTDIFINFDTGLTKKDISQISEIINSVFGDNSTLLYPPDPIAPDDIRISKMIMVISLIVIMIVVLAIAKLYMFIIDSKNRVFKIFGLCGSNLKQIVMIYLSETIIITFLSSFIGVSIFRFFIFDYVSKLYPAFIEYYNISTFLLVTMSYLAITFLIMFFAILSYIRRELCYYNRKEKN